MIAETMASPARPRRARPANWEGRAHRLRDGRLLGYADYGDPEGAPVLAFHGTPGCRFMFRLADGPARERGLRLIAPDRPGYGLSDPHVRRTPESWAGDVAELANGLDVGDFAVVGISGGGPYAVACAAVLGPRVKAIGLISPLGPVWAGEVAAGLSAMERQLFSRLPAWSWGSRRAFGVMRWALTRVPRLSVWAFARRLPPADRAVLARAEVCANLLESLQEGLRPGMEGAVQDLQLFSRDWGVALAEARAPACIWQGDADRNVPVAAARFLADALPQCTYLELAGEGHFLAFDHFTDVLDWVAEAAA